MQLPSLEREKMAVMGSRNYTTLEPRYKEDGNVVFGGSENPQDNKSLHDFFGKEKLTVHYLNCQVGNFNPDVQKVEDYDKYIDKTVVYKNDDCAKEAFRDARLALEERCREDWQNPDGIIYGPHDCLICNEDGVMRGVFRVDMGKSSTQYTLVANPEICKFEDKTLEQTSDNAQTEVPEE